MAFKLCPRCGEKCPARIRKCKKCDGTFAFKIKKKKAKTTSVSDWKALATGDRIKVSGGSVYIDKQGNEMSMGYSGVFSVCSVDEKGIVACGKDKTSGFCHIWMVEETVSEMGILKRPHKIRRINVN